MRRLASDAIDTGTTLAALQPLMQDSVLRDIIIACKHADEVLVPTTALAVHKLHRLSAQVGLYRQALRMAEHTKILLMDEAQGMLLLLAEWYVV